MVVHHEVIRRVGLIHFLAPLIRGLEKYLRFFKSNYKRLVTEFTIFVKIKYLQTDSEKINQHETNAAFPMKAEPVCIPYYFTPFAACGNSV